MAFELVYRVNVVGVYDARSAEPTEELSEEVDGETPPGELAEEAEVERYGGVEKTA